MTDTKICAGCGAAFERPRGVRPAVWNKRRYCSRACGAKHALRDVHVGLPEVKPCERCGEMFARPQNYTNMQWSERRYCSRRCMGRARSDAAYEERPARICAICQTEFRTNLPITQAATCGHPECQRRYKREVAGAKLSRRMKADYAAGRRMPSIGLSPRELALWPHLRDAGWVWGLRWVDASGEYQMDFARLDQRLNVELDGDEHRWGSRPTRDAARDAELERQGWRILRIPNREVDADPAAVADRVLAWARDSRT